MNAIRIRTSCLTNCSHTQHDISCWNYQLRAKVTGFWRVPVVVSFIHQWNLWDHMSGQTVQHMFHHFSINAPGTTKIMSGMLRILMTGDISWHVCECQWSVRLDNSSNMSCDLWFSWHVACPVMFGSERARRVAHQLFYIRYRVWRVWKVLIWPFQGCFVTLPLERASFASEALYIVVQWITRTVTVWHLSSVAILMVDHFNRTTEIAFEAWNVELGHPRQWPRNIIIGRIVFQCLPTNELDIIRLSSENWAKADASIN